MTNKQFSLLILLLLSLTILSHAQTDEVTLPDPQLVEITAEDGLALAGEFYAVSDTQLPTVLLLHELDGSREDWSVFLEPLITLGYNALAVDLRGHGETGGEQNWELAVGDVQNWLNWMKEQPDIQTNGISIIGADLGGNLAVIACENDDICLTSIAISPMAIGCEARDCTEGLENLDQDSLEFLDDTTATSLTNQNRRSAVLLIASRDDDPSVQGFRQIGRTKAPNVELLTASLRGHGMELIGVGDQVRDDSIKWLDGRTPPNLTDAELEEMVANADPLNGESLFVEDRSDPTGGNIYGSTAGLSCVHCHKLNLEDQSASYPSLMGISEVAAQRVPEQSAPVYLYYSIVAPSAYVVGNYSQNMPWRLENAYTNDEIADIVAYLLTL